MSYHVFVCKLIFPSLSHSLPLILLGERQKLGFARLLYHRPRFAILDEATSSLDEESEASLYALLKAPLPALNDSGLASGQMTDICGQFQSADEREFLPSEVGATESRAVSQSKTTTTTTILSVAHRRSVRKFHSMELNFLGNGEWSYLPIVH